MSTQKINSDTTTNLLPTVSPINAGQIVMIEGNQITMLDTSTMQKKPLPIPSLNNPASLTFSVDGNILYTDSDLNTVIIYDMKTGNLKTLPKMEPNPRVEETGHVSPDNKYFILTQSTGPGDVGRTIINMDGKIIKTLTGGNVAWSPNSSALAISKREFILGLPAGPKNSSIYLEQMNNDIVIEKILVKGSNQISYSPVKWNDNDTLLIEKTMYDKPIPSNFDLNNIETYDNWMKIYETPKISYLTIDVKSLKIDKALYEEKPFDKSSYSSDHLWKVFTEGNSMFGPTFVSRADGSQKLKISDHAYAVWKTISQ